MLVAACYKDKGNYTYSVPETPMVSNLDTVYAAVVGDSLIISPTITKSDGSADLTLNWSIAVPEELKSLELTGPQLRMIFSLGAKRYRTKLTITDNSNGMKYFRFFDIDGQTVFSKGMTVLSSENGQAQLSFVKPDGSVQPRVYEALHDGEKLEGTPKQVVALLNQYIAPATISSYWITGQGGNDPGVQIDANTFKKIKTIRQNFFEPPAAVSPGMFESAVNGVLLGVANGKLYTGTAQTWSGSPVYGMFGLPAQGEYNLFEQAAFNPVMPYFLGYDKDKKHFVGFTNFGSAGYIGTTYQTAGNSSFDLKNTGLDLLFFNQINGNNCFAIGRDANGVLQEVKFGAAFMGFVQLSPIHKRPFIRPELVTTNTKWASTPAEIFYFNSGSKVYRYNPLNEEVRALDTDFGGKEVTMVKTSADGNTLYAGVEGSVYVLDVSTGKFGNVLSKIDNIPGAPVDLAVRER